MMMAGMFLKDVRGALIPPAKIHGIWVAQAAHTPGLYHETKPDGAEWALYVEGKEYERETLEMEETRTVIGWVRRREASPCRF